MCLQAENCLFCFADIDIRNPVETTLELLEKAQEQKEFLGVKIHPTNTGYPVDGAYYDRVFAWADQSRVPVEIHSYPMPASRMMSVPPHASGMLSGNTPHCAFPWRMPAGSNTRSSSVSACTSISPLC